MDKTKGGTRRGNRKITVRISSLRNSDPYPCIMEGKEARHKNKLFTKNEIQIIITLQTFFKQSQVTEMKLVTSY